MNAESGTANGTARRRFGDRYVVAADRVFDGTQVLEGHAVAVTGDKITAVAPASRLSGQGEVVRFAGTLLPGFIELHAHLRLGQVPPDIVLRHGLTTVRETGGPLAPPSGDHRRGPCARPDRLGPSQRARRSRARPGRRRR